MISMQNRIKRSIAIDVSGVTEFDNGDLFAWTEGRGGFVVPGGIAYWPKQATDAESAEAMKIAGDICDRDYGSGLDFIMEEVHDWCDLPQDVKEKLSDMEHVFQASPGGKYSLQTWLSSEDEE